MTKMTVFYKANNYLYNKRVATEIVITYSFLYSYVGKVFLSLSNIAAYLREHSGRFFVYKNTRSAGTLEYLTTN